MHYHIVTVKGIVLAKKFASVMKAMEALETNSELHIMPCLGEFCVEEDTCQST